MRGPESATFAQRLASGHLGQQALVAALEGLGFQVMVTGQEAWLNAIVHDALRFEHNDLMTRAVRYQSDLLAYHTNFPLAYWEVKVNTTPGTSNFAIEKACYEEAMARTFKGERIVFAFQEVEKTWHTQWVQELDIACDMSAVRGLAHGSHTPFLLIRKSSALPLVKFLRTFGTIGTWPTT